MNHPVTRYYYRRNLKILRDYPEGYRSVLSPLGSEGTISRMRDMIVPTKFIKVKITQIQSILKIP